MPPTLPAHPPFLSPLSARDHSSTDPLPPVRHKVPCPAALAVRLGLGVHHPAIGQPVVVATRARARAHREWAHGLSEVPVTVVCPRAWQEGVSAGWEDRSEDGSRAEDREGKGSRLIQTLRGGVLPAPIGARPRLNRAWCSTARRCSPSVAAPGPYRAGAVTNVVGD